MRQLQTICVALIVAALYAGAARAQVTTATDSTAFHVFNTGSTSDLLRVQSNSFVGIGTTTPGVLLDLKGSNQPYGGQLRLQGTDFDQITFYNSANPAQNGTNRMGFIYYDVVNNLLGIDNEAGNKYLLLNQTGGNVGIGTTTPLAILTAQKANATTFLGLSGNSGSYADISLGRTATEARLGIAASEAGGGQFAIGAKIGDVILRVDDATKNLHLLAGSGHPVVTITNASVGIGAVPTSATLQINTPGGPISGATFKDNPGIPGSILLDMGAGEVDVAAVKIGGLAWPTINTTSGPLYLQYSAGDVVIGNGTHGGLTVNGSVTVNGTVYANYQDVAEWVPAAESMSPGTVVVISGETDNTVTASTHAYDTGIAGVVSPTPGLLLGVASDSKAKIATTGRVRVRVDASKGPIQKGDLLVTSDRPGMAMKSEPLDIGGTKIHRPGTLVGKALEPLAGGEGEILVLLSLQ
jgi:hypothetical protein